MEDVDKNFFHWVVVNMPRDRNSIDPGLGNASPIPSDLTDLPTAAANLIQGTNTFGNPGYGGPCPPANDEHVYRFRLYALDAALQEGEGSTAANVLDSMKGHVIGWGELSGTYRR
jgi:Raf kinase inhibitor-like YbhB/YbcL family protein